MIIHKYKDLWQLLLLYVVLLIGGFLLIDYTQIPLQKIQYASLLSVMTLITLGAFFLVSVAKNKEAKDRGIFLLAAIGGKFLAYLFLILIFWLNTKNLTSTFIIAFFVLYLLLTTYLVRILLKMLKDN